MNVPKARSAEMNATQIDLYQKAQASDGSIHMLWTEDGTARQMLCGRSKATAVTADLLRARVSCQRCRDRAIAIVAGDDSPRGVR